MDWCVNFPKEQIIMARPSLRKACGGNRNAAKLLSYLLYRVSIRENAKLEAERINELRRQQGLEPNQDTSTSICRTQAQIVCEMDDELSDRTLRDDAIPCLENLLFISLEEIKGNRQFTIYTLNLEVVQAAIDHPETVPNYETLPYFKALHKKRAEKWKRNVSARKRFRSETLPDGSETFLNGSETLPNPHAQPLGNTSEPSNGYGDAQEASLAALSEAPKNLEDITDKSNTEREGAAFADATPAPSSIASVTVIANETDTHYHPIASEGLQETDDVEATQKRPAIQIVKGVMSDDGSSVAAVDSGLLCGSGIDSDSVFPAPAGDGSNRRDRMAGMGTSQESRDASASLEAATQHTPVTASLSPSHRGGAARTGIPQTSEPRVPDVDSLPALSHDAGQAIGEGNGAVQASGGKKPRKSPVEQPAGPPQEPPADMAWGTRKCLLLFDFWRGAQLIGKWKLQKASECAMGLAKQYSEAYIVAAKEVMDADPYWGDQGGIDVCSMANNIHKYRRKIERKLGVQRNAAVLDFSKAVCIDTQFRVYQVPGDDREWILWEGEYLSPEEADKRGYNGGFGLYNVTEYDFVPNGIGRGVS